MNRLMVLKVSSKKVKDHIDLIYARASVLSFNACAQIYAFCLFLFESFRNFVYFADCAFKYSPDVGFFIMYNHVRLISSIFRLLLKDRGYIPKYIFAFSFFSSTVLRMVDSVGTMAFHGHFPGNCTIE